MTIQYELSFGVLDSCLHVVDNETALKTRDSGCHKARTLTHVRPTLKPPAHMLLVSWEAPLRAC